MKSIFQYIILSILVSALSACTQDYYSMSQENSPLAENEYEFSLMVDNASLRSRTVNFDENGSLRLNHVWVGVFDIATGKCVAKNTKTLNYATIRAGQENEGLLRIKLDAPSSVSPSGYVIVSFANFLGVLDESGDDIEDRLMNLETWREFNEIAVDAASAYSDLHNSTTPVLAGFLYTNTYSDQSHIKIDQFRESQEPNNQGVLLSPSYLADYVKTEFKDGKYDNTNKVLKFRRLVANINVNIHLTEEAQTHLTLTDVSYKRYNMPRAVYIIERRTTDCIVANNGSYTPGNFADINNPQNSPNYADLNPEKDYYNDTDWQYGNVTGFSFQHFANKHWARYDLVEQTDREKCTKYGTDANGENIYYYHSLVGNNPTIEEGKIKDFNNYASYFVIKMHLIDNTTGQALEAEYTIHEGYTSDELGVGIAKEETNGNKIATRLKDFVVARNIDYYYDVYINGVNNIYYNVNTSTSNEDHKSGQGGRIWQFYYASDATDVTGEHPEGDSRPTSGKCTYNNVTGFDELMTVPSTGGYYKNAIKINNENPDLAFRLYGYTSHRNTIEGYNYNFPQESFTWLSGLWPPSAGDYSHYFQDYEELVSTDNVDAIPNDLLSGLKIIDPSDPGNEMTLPMFIYNVGQLTGPVNKTYDIKVYPTDITDAEKNETVPWEERNNYVRALYIADRKGQPDIVDGCTKLVNIFAAVQYPALAEKKQEPVKLPLPRYNQQSVSNYNIIDQYLSAIRIPVLVGYDTKDYSYELKINGKDYSSYGSRSNDYFEYIIPMNEFEGTTGDITLIVKSHNELYLDSSSVTIGSVDLRNHAAWKYNDKEDWDEYLGKLAANSSYYQCKNYLLFDAGTGTFSISNSQNIAMPNNSSIIYFNIYRPCKVTVSYPAADAPNNGKTRKFKLYENSIETYISEETVYGKAGSVTFTIPESDFKGEKVLQIGIGRGDGTAHYVSGIQVTP